MSLNYFFNPRAVAIVGASANPAKLGRQILDNIIKNGFKGRIYPVNLKESKVAGLPAYADLANLPTVDYASLLVIIAIPASLVLTELKKCAALGIRNIIIITAGFKENGPEGLSLENEIIKLARKHKLNILGPNCLGLINTWQHLNATFAAADKETGNSALLSQSGAIGAAALDWLKIKDFNFGYFISLGNQAVIDENKILDYLAHDSRIDLVVAYLEEIKDGQRFMEIVSRLSKHKPVAVLKSGISAAGSQLALSHTGSLAGSAAAVRTGLERAGAIWLENLEELFNLLLLFRKESWHNLGRQELYLITNAGGVAVLTADEVGRQNLPFGHSQDLLGDADAARYDAAIKKALADKKINNLLVLLTPQTSTEPLKTAEAIVAIAKKYPHKLIMTSFVGGRDVQSARALFAKNNIPTFDFPEEAVRSFKKLIVYKETLKNIRPYKRFSFKIKAKITTDDYLASFRLLKQYKIPVVKTTRFSPAYLKTYKYPVVLKITGPDFLHKTDTGSVVINLKNVAELKAAVSSLQTKNRSALNNSKNYLVIQTQATKFQEIILGFKRDSAFGPIMMIGQGGIYTEVFKDFKLAISDLDRTRALELIGALKIYPILNGARRQKKYDIIALADALVNLARLANEHPEISELDINPLFVTEKGVSAGDVRIIL
ncbi:MAG: acetate--CoA ligase family protein [Patescibacteria group bacterium]|jgi:acetyltransferase